MLQLEIELTSLAKETDDASVQRREGLERELAELRERSDAMKAEWQAEKDAISDVQHIKERLEQAQRELEKAEREADLELAAKLRHGEIPELRARLLTAEAAQDNGGVGATNPPRATSRRRSTPRTSRPSSRAGPASRSAACWRARSRS